MLLLVVAVVRAPDVARGVTAATTAGSAVLRSASLVRANLGAMLFVGSFIASRCCS